MNPAQPMASTADREIPTASPARGAWGWLRLGVADLLLFILVIGIMQRSVGSMLDDPGLGWHIRHIDAMQEAGGWLEVDSFSGPRGGQPWITNQWLGDLVLHFGWQWGGLEGIAAVTTLFLGFTFWLLYRFLLADGVAWPLALVWTFLGALGTSLSWVARPNVATLLLVMVTAAMVDRYHRGACSRRSTWWLLPLFTIWANTHGGFVAGLVILAAASMVEFGWAFVLQQASKRIAARQRAAHFGMLLVGAVLATLINPYGWRLYSWVFQLLGDPFFMNLHTEWRSPNFHEVGAMRYEWLMLALPLFLAFSRRRAVSVMALAISLLWLHFALGGARYVALWVVVTIPLLARLSADIVHQVVRRRPDLPRLPRVPQGGWLGPILIGAVLMLWARGVEGYSRHDPHHLPTDALRYVIDHHSDDVVFHEYGWGGWLTWHGWPQMKNWIDDRNEVQGQAHVEQYFALIEAAPGWKQTLADHEVRVACVSVDAPLARALADDPDWSQQYADRYAVVYTFGQPS